MAGKQVRCFVVLGLDELASIGGTWSIASLPEGTRECSLLRPNLAIAERWSERSGREHGLVLHFDVHPDSHLSQEKAGQGDTAFSLGPDMWSRVVASHEQSQTEVTAGFVTSGGTVHRWQPWFDVSGIDRLLAEFGSEAPAAIHAILEAMGDHYALKEADADWNRPLLRRVGLRLAAQSGGDLGVLAESIDVAQRDLRDI